MATETAEKKVERSLLRTIEGVVASDKGDKTIKVVVNYQMKHAKYGKYLKRRTTLHAHDEKNEAKEGDKVEIAECRPMSKTKSPTPRHWARGWLMPAVIVALGLLGALFNRRPHLILTDNRARLLTGSLGALFGILFMFSLAPTGVEFFPDTDPTQVRITAEGPLGMNIDASNTLAQAVEERINSLYAEHPEVRANVKNELTGVGTGGDVMFGGGAASPERSEITINLVDYNDQRRP